MRRLLPCLLFLSLATPVFAQHLQTVSYTSASPKQTTPTPTLRATANLVVVDVVVRDEHGKPIRNLKQEDFALLEGATAQRIRNFEEHTADQIVPATAMPKLSPGVFTNLNPAGSGKGPLYILMLDKLNTAFPDQAKLRTELLKFIDTAKPGARIAIFQLSDRLQLLQGFTDDHDLLHAALTKFSPSKPMLSDARTMFYWTPRQDWCDTTNASAGPCDEILWGRSRQRSNSVLDVMGALNAFASGMSGRKNLLWYSGNFPLYFLVNPPDGAPPGNDASLVNDFRRAADQLAANQVSIYPIDARGLASSQFNDIGDVMHSDFDRHANRNELGSMTGGKAYYDLNGMDTITADAIDDGANYYVLAYTPTDTRLNGDYRKIQVKLSGNRTAQLSYRQGYYANDPNQLVKPSIFGKAKPGNERRPDAMEMAMMLGAPVATQIVFAAHVTPASAGPDKDVAPGNKPGKDLKGPYRRYAVRVTADIITARLTQSADGIRHGSFQYLIYVYNRDAAVVNGTSRVAALDIKPAVYQQLLKDGLPVEFEISVPVKGDYTFRIAVRDLNDDHVGSVEVPVSAVPPAVAAK